MAAPVLVAMTLQSVYALTDLYFVGRLGNEAVGGLAVSLQVFFIVLAVGQVLGTTALASISQKYGGGRVDEARGVFSAYIVMTVVIGLVCWAGMYALAEPYVSFFTEDAGVHRLGLIYFKINAATFLTQLISMTLGASFRGSGDFITPVRLMSASIIVNAVLDPVLIFGADMGIAGAAWATIIGQSVVVFGYLGVLTMKASSERALRFTRPAFSRTFFRHLITRGAPAGVQFLMLSALLAIVLGAMKPYGEDWTAGAGGGYRVLQQGFLPLVALGSAAAATSGQNMGAGKPDRIKRAAQLATLWGMGYAVVATMLLYFGAPLIARLFTDAESAVGAITYFKWSAPTYLAFAISIITTHILQALGRPILPMAAATVRIVLLWAIVYQLLPVYEAGPQWVFGAATFSSLIESVIGFALLRHEVMRQIRVTRRG